MDSQVIATGSVEPHETQDAHEHPPYLVHHFATMGQQVETASFGMWLFLLTEIMFFGGMFMAYLLYRNWYYDAFVAGSNLLSIQLGTTMTAVLILSSFTVAMGVYSAEMRNRKGLIISLVLTLMLGLLLSWREGRTSGTGNISSTIFPAPTSALRTLSIRRTSGMFPWRRMWRNTRRSSFSSISP